jgi:hypothetical protein
MTTNPSTPALDYAHALREIRALARKERRWLAGTADADLAPTPAEVRGAAALLADLYAAGRAHGITPDEWWVIADLPEAAIGAMVHLDRTRTPDRRDRDQDRDGTGPVPWGERVPAAFPPRRPYRPRPRWLGRSRRRDRDQHPQEG